MSDSTWTIQPNDKLQLELIEMTRQCDMLTQLVKEKEEYVDRNLKTLSDAVDMCMRLEKTTLETSAQYRTLYASHERVCKELSTLSSRYEADIKRQNALNSQLAEDNRELHFEVMRLRRSLKAEIMTHKPHLSRPVEDTPGSWRASYVPAPAWQQKWREHK